MPLKLTVGLCRKVGQPDYGSLGATCNVEVELPSSALDDLEAFHRHARAVYAACQQAVNEQLAGSQANAAANGNGQSRAKPASRTEPAAGSSNNGSNAHAASEKQIGYLRQLAKQVDGLGIRRLETLSQKMHGKPLAALTSLEASGMIDTLKAAKEGRIDLAAVLEGKQE
jgi:hypothetical protein